MWSHKWGYREGVVLASLPVIIGALQQWILGPIPKGAWVYPANAIVGIAETLLCCLVAFWGYRRKRRPFLAGGAATLSSLTVFILLTLIVGFTRQIPSTIAATQAGVIHRIGLSALLESRAFIMLYLYLLLVLGVATLYRLLHFRMIVRDLAFAFNHVGLYIFLLFGLLSSADMQRSVMTLSSEAENPEWRALDESNNRIIEHPIALELRRFEMEEYPPKLMLFDAKIEALIPDGHPVHISLEDTLKRNYTLGEWQVALLEYLPLAAPVVGREEIIFKPFASMGGAAAAHIRVTGRNGESYSGWVSNGSYLFPYRSLLLSDSISVVMPEREPKQFASHITYYTPEGESASKTIRVNSPLRVGDLYIYQLGYDRSKGRWSTTSELEVVYDPWIVPVYIGIALMMMGALFLLLGPLGASSPTTSTKKDEIAL